MNFDFPPINKERAYDAIEVMRTVASAKGCTVPQVAIAWLLHQKVVTSVIIGAKRVDQLSDNIGATEVELSALDAVTALPAEYPGWMLAFQNEYRANLLADQPRS